MDFKNFISDGKLELDNNVFFFHFEKNILTIFPDNIKEYWNDYRHVYFRVKSSKLEKQNYYGTTINGNSIVFINVELVMYGRGFYKGFVPAYIYGKDNGYVPAPKAQNFISMQFRGKCVDQLYNPKNLIKSKRITKRLVPEFKFYNSRKIAKKININDDEFNFGVMWTVSNKELNYPISLKSQIWIKFNNKKNIKEIISYYKSIYEVFCFLYNRKTIQFDEIKLTSKIWISKTPFDTWKNKKRRLISTDYYLHINFENEKDIDLSDINLSLSIDTLSNHFESLYNILSGEIDTLFSYPNNLYEENHVDAYQFTNIASSFEGQFDKLHPKDKSTHHVKYKMLKEKILEYISELKTSEISKKEEEYINNFYDCIYNLDGALHEQISRSLKEFRIPLEKIKRRLFTYYNIKNTNNGHLSEAFANKRNKIIHTAKCTPFSNTEIVSYLLVRCLIHCIVLKRADFSISEITEIINKIF